MTKAVYYRNKHMTLLEEAALCRSKLRYAKIPAARAYLKEDHKKAINRCYLLRCKFNPNNPVLQLAA